MNITIENLELSVDSEVLIEEIRDDIQQMIQDVVSSQISSIVDDAVSEALDDRLSDEVGTAVTEELRYNFDIEDHIDYDDVADEVNRRTETSLTIAQLNDMLDSAPVRDQLMLIIAEQIVLGTPYKVLQKLD